MFNVAKTLSISVHKLSKTYSRAWELEHGEVQEDCFVQVSPLSIRDGLG